MDVGKENYECQRIVFSELSRDASICLLIFWTAHTPERWSPVRELRRQSRDGTPVTRLSSKCLDDQSLHKPERSEWASLGAVGECTWKR